MSKPVVNLDGEKFQWLEKGTDNPVYTIYAKSEKKAYKQLVSYLSKVGKLSALDNMEKCHASD